MITVLVHCIKPLRLNSKFTLYTAIRLCTQKNNDHQTPYSFYRTHLSVGHYTIKLNCTPHLNALSGCANKYRLIGHWKQFYFSLLVRE